MSNLVSYFPEGKNMKLFIDFSAAVIVANILDCYSALRLKNTEVAL